MPNAAALGLCTSGKDPVYVLHVRPDGLVHRVTGYAGPETRYLVPSLGQPVDPATWCEPTHATCDCNPDVDLPPEVEVHWRYGDKTPIAGRTLPDLPDDADAGGHPMTTRERARPTRFCVDCLLFMLAERLPSGDWDSIAYLREQATLNRKAA